MIIVEGPDNSGKSTLVKYLADKYKLEVLQPLSKGPPSNIEELYSNTKSLILQAIHKGRGCIVDRMPLIGESIYGPICREKDLWVPYFDYKVRLQKSINTLEPFYIYCRPTDGMILDMTTHQVKEYDTEEHLNKIKQNKRLILDAYDNYFVNFGNHNFFRYDYNNPQHLGQLNERLKEYLKW